MKLKLTAIDYTVLGLLNQQPMSGYGVLKIFETTALGNYSGSPGTIYPAIKKLVRLKLLKSKQIEGKARFVITKRGLNSLTAWLKHKITEDDVKKDLNYLLLRFAFMNELLSREEKAEFLRSLNANVSNYLKHLAEFYRKERRKMDLHARLSLKNGIEIYQTHLKWGKSTLKLFLNT